MTSAPHAAQRIICGRYAGRRAKSISGRAPRPWPRSITRA